MKIIKNTEDYINFISILLENNNIEINHFNLIGNFKIKNTTYNFEFEQNDEKIFIFNSNIRLTNLKLRNITIISAYIKIFNNIIKNYNPNVLVINELNYFIIRNDFYKLFIEKLINKNKEYKLYNNQNNYIIYKNNFDMENILDKI